MCKQCDNVLKFEIPNPSKSEKKVLKQKNLDMETNSEEEDSIENDLKKSYGMNTMYMLIKFSLMVFFNFINSINVFIILLIFIVSLLFLQ